MKIKNIIVLLISYFIVQAASAVELKDATLRDEDISASTISVEYFTRPDGLMEYVYTIKSPSTNKGDIEELLINLYCDVNFEPAVLPYATSKEGYIGAVLLGKPAYTPTAIRADYGSSGIYGITENNEALWGVGILPGKTTTGLRLISPAKPGMRTYIITPWVDYTEGGWDLPEDISLVPKDFDFAITGMIAGPGCPGVTEPPSETNLYTGTGFRVEPENINALLSYRSPQKDRFHVVSGIKETTLHIFYSKEIDAKTFKVQPAWMKRFFNPVAGTDEQVILPLNKARNKIKLSVHTNKTTGTTRKGNESHHSYKDTDVFEIRVDKK